MKEEVKDPSLSPTGRKRESTPRDAPQNPDPAEAPALELAVPGEEAPEDANSKVSNT